MKKGPFMTQGAPCNATRKGDLLTKTVDNTYDAIEHRMDHFSERKSTQ